MLHVEWYHVCWPRLTAKRVEPVVSISWASCFESDFRWYFQWTLKKIKNVAKIKKTFKTKKNVPWIKNVKNVFFTSMIVSYRIVQMTCRVTSWWCRTRAGNQRRNTVVDTTVTWSEFSTMKNSRHSTLTCYNRSTVSTMHSRAGSGIYTISRVCTVVHYAVLVAIHMEKN